MRLGEILKKRRLELGKSVSELALECGVSKMYIWYLESGQRTPSYPLLEIVCDKLKLDIEFVKRKMGGKNV